MIIILLDFTFCGCATEYRTKYFVNRLIKSLKDEDIGTYGEIMVAQYNSPWVPPPFRKNEIIISIN